MAECADSPGSVVAPRIRVFVDYWNLQLTINERESALRGGADHRFSIAWGKFPLWVAGRAADLSGSKSYSFDGAIIYASHDSSEEGRKFHTFVTGLNRQPGIQVQCRLRKPKSPTRCNHCHKPVLTCPHCGKGLSPKVEKGVDTAIATDMIRLAWEGAYDIAVLVSLDADLIPAVEFLDAKGKKVIQAGFPPKGQELMKACWASIDLFPDRANFEFVRRG